MKSMDGGLYKEYIYIYWIILQNLITSQSFYIWISYKNLSNYEAKAKIKNRGICSDVEFARRYYSFG